MNQKNNRDLYSIEKGQRKALTLFHSASIRVPAYKKFLRKFHINPSHIKTIADFSEIPVMTKENYLNHHALKDLVWDADLTKTMMISASSGTTGLPYFWPFTKGHVDEGAVIKNMIYRRCYAVDKHPTLMIICFGMGTWTAGIFTTLTTLATHTNGLPIALITPGFNKEETLRILETLAPQYEQVVIAGIPTFIKDLLEQWHAKRTKNKIKRIKLLFTGEGFSEDWRTYVLHLIDSTDYSHDAISILGSADACIMGFETPESITVRRLATTDSTLRNQLFHSERVPSLAAFIPTQRYFETEQNELLLSADRSIPLIRYNIHDIGGIIPYDTAKTYIKSPSASLPLPFVYVFGRGKFTATIYAANIYPENIRDVLLHPQIVDKVTGKFVIETRYDHAQNHHLHMDVELASNITPCDSLIQGIVSSFVSTVQKKNSEYHRVYQEYGDKAAPLVTLHRYGESPLFPTDKIKKLS